MFGFEWCCLHCGIPHTPSQLLCLQCHSKVDWVSIHMPSLAAQLQYECSVERVYIGAIFKKATPIQSLIKAIKYQGRKDLARKAGELIAYGFQIPKDSILIPVPLHPKKEFIRGFNQAEELAKGIQKGSKNTLIMKILKRNAYSSSLTTQDRLKRSQQSELYSATRVEVPEQAELVLVDDVLTTGATALQCLNALYQVYGKKVNYSIAVLAYADNT